MDIVIPETESFSTTEKEKFWTFFRGLGESVDIEAYRIQTSSKKDNLPKFKPGEKVNAEGGGLTLIVYRLTS